MSQVQVAATYFTVGAILSWILYGNAKTSPDMGHVFVATVFWPVIVGLGAFCGLFMAGAWAISKVTSEEVL